MKNLKKLSHQGIREVEDKAINTMKIRFKEEFIDKFPIKDGDDQNSKGRTGLKTTGYFIGKALLNRILTENDDEAAGIIFSFGLSESLANGGELVLTLELASGIDRDDNPNIINDSDKYSTGGDGNDGPDDTIPAIKPKG